MQKSADVAEIYSEDKQLKKDDVRALIQWAEKQAHLPEISELGAILFLQSCYYSNESAKTAIDNYYTIKTLCPEIFKGRNPTKSPLKESLDVCVFTVLPKKTSDGDSIIFAKIVDCNPDNYVFAQQLKHFDMVVMSDLYKHGPSNGHLIVFDMDGIVFGHMTKLGPLVMKKFLYYLQEAMPLRLKGLHYVNVVSFMDKILALMRPFMKKELLDMLHLHNDVNSLIKFVPRECLPGDYGGQVKGVKELHEETKRGLIDNVSFFEFEDRQVVDETLRAGKPKNVGSIFGVEGTFKKLELD